VSKTHFVPFKPKKKNRRASTTGKWYYTEIQAGGQWNTKKSRGRSLEKKCIKTRGSPPGGVSIGEGLVSRESYLFKFPSWAGNASNASEKKKTGAGGGEDKNNYLRRGEKELRAAASDCQSLNEPPGGEGGIGICRA